MSAQINAQVEGSNNHFLADNNCNNELQPSSLQEAKQIKQTLQGQIDSTPSSQNTEHLEIKSSNQENNKDLSNVSAQPEINLIQDLNNVKQAKISQKRKISQSHEDSLNNKGNTLDKIIIESKKQRSQTTSTSSETQFPTTIQETTSELPHSQTADNIEQSNGKKANQVDEGEDNQAITQEISTQIASASKIRKKKEGGASLKKYKKDLQSTPEQTNQNIITSASVEKGIENTKSIESLIQPNEILQKKSSLHLLEAQQIKMEIERGSGKKLSNKTPKASEEIVNLKHIDSSRESEKNSLEDEDDEEYEEGGISRSKKDRFGSAKSRKKARTSESKDKNSLKDRVTERKRGIRDLVPDEKWGVYERYQDLKSYRGVGREYNMDHSTVKLLINRIEAEQKGSEVTKERFYQGDIAKQGQEPTMTKKMKKELSKKARNKDFSDLGQDNEGHTIFFDQDLNNSDGNQPEEIIGSKMKKQKKNQYGLTYYSEGMGDLTQDEYLMQDKNPLSLGSKSKSKLSVEEKEQRKELRQQKKLLKLEENGPKKKQRAKLLSDLGEDIGYTSGSQQQQFNSHAPQQSQNQQQSNQPSNNIFLDTDINHISFGYDPNLFPQYPQTGTTQSQQQTGYSGYDGNTAYGMQYNNLGLFEQNNNQQQTQDEFDRIIDNIDLQHTNNITQTQCTQNHNNNSNNNNNNNNNASGFDDEIRLELS